MCCNRHWLPTCSTCLLFDLIFSLWLLVGQFTFSSFFPIMLTFLHLQPMDDSPQLHTTSGIVYYMSPPHTKCSQLRQTNKRQLRRRDSHPSRSRKGVWFTSAPILFNLLYLTSISTVWRKKTSTSNSESTSSKNNSPNSLQTKLMQPSKKYQPQDYNVHRNRERELEDKLEEHERELRDLRRRKSGIPIMHLSVERFLQNNRRVPGVSHFFYYSIL